MAASTVTRANINDTDANFRLWGKAISDALAAMGFVKDTDASQINWATVSHPGSANTAQGYEVWRSDDAATGIDNFYFKIEYGSGAAANTPAIWLTFGWSSNGSGTIGGNANTRTQVTFSANSSTPVNCNFAGSGTGGWFTLGLFFTGTGIGRIVSCERTRDSSGTQLDEIFVWTSMPSGAGPISQVIPHTGTISTNNTIVNAAQGSGWRVPVAATAGYGAGKGLGTLAPQKGGFLMESINVLAGDTTNYVTAQQQFTINTYGASHNYILSAVSSDGAVGIGSLLQRYE